MKDRLFWKIFAAGALIVAAAYVGVLLRNGRPVYSKAEAGGGAIEGVIAFTSDSSNSSRLFIINPSKKVILVYQAAGSTDKGVSLVAGRSFAADEDLCSHGEGIEIPYKSDGYSIVDVKKTLDSVGRKRP